MELDKIYNMDCLEGMKHIPDGSVDAIICDLPYGVLNSESEGGGWDSLIPFEPLWEQYLRIGYDAYDSKRFINAIGAWIFSLGNDPTAYLTPVSQTFATYNGPVQDMTYMIKNDPAVIHFYKSPLWGWEFSNCMLAESNDGYDNVKPVKSSPTAKVDNVQALLSALWLYCQVNGTVQK